MFKKAIIMCVVFILVACSAPSQLEPEDATRINPLQNGEQSARPDIERTYEGTQENTRPSPSTQQTNKTGFLREVTVDSGNENVHVLETDAGISLNIPLGYTFSEAYPGVGREVLPLLRPEAVRGVLGNTQSYEQFFTFNGGKVTFVHDTRSSEEYIGTVLEFNEDEPFMNYTFFMKGRPFYDHTIVGSDVVLLGGTYKILEATNFSLLLAGVDVEQYLDIENGSRLKTNKKTIANTQVHYDGFGFTIEFLAPGTDGDFMWLHEGETLRDKYLAEREIEALFGSLFNIRYDGLEVLDKRVPELPLTFDVHDEYVEMVWTYNDERIRLPLLGLNSSGDIWMGNEKRTHYHECTSRNDGCIAIGDVVAVTGVVIEEDGTRVHMTRLLELGGIDSEEQKITFRDIVSRTRVSVDYETTFNGAQSTRLPLFTSQYPIYVYNTTTNNVSEPTYIAMDLDGDQGINNRKQTLYIDDVYIEYTFANDTVDLSIKTLPKMLAQARNYRGIINHEELHVRLSHDGSEFTVELPLVNTSVRNAQLWNQELFMDENENTAYGLSPWGTSVVLDVTDANNAQVSTNDVTVIIPFTQRLARVRIGAFE